MDYGVWERMGEECAHRGDVAIKEVSEEKVPDALEMKSLLLAYRKRQLHVMSQRRLPKALQGDGHSAISSHDLSMTLRGGEAPLLEKLWLFQLQHTRCS